MPGRELNTAISINEQKHCVWCGNNRHQLSRYCGMCKSAYYRWGQPNGKALPSSHYTSTKEECIKLLSVNRDKRGVQTALAYCQNFMDKASKDSLRVPNPIGCISELQRRGVTAEEMLIEAISVYIYCFSLTTSSPHWNTKYQMGNAILNLRRYARPSTIIGNHRREVGEYLLALRPLYEKFKQAIRRQKKCKQSLEAVLSGDDLDITTTGSREQNG